MLLQDVFNQAIVKDLWEKVPLFLKFKKWVENLHNLTRNAMNNVDLDIFVFFAQVDLAIQEKEQYMNVARWFDHIQHYPSVRHHLPPVVVLRNRIYTSRCHWDMTTVASLLQPAQPDPLQLQFFRPDPGH